MRSKKTIYNITSTLVLQIITIIYGFIVPKIIISKFGSDVNGLITSITQFLSYISLLESGIGPVVKASLYKPISKKNKSEITNILYSTEKFFRVISYIFLGYIVVLALGYPLIVSNEFGYIYTLSLVVIIAISTFAEYYFGMVYNLFLQSDQKMYVISLIKIISYIVSIIVIVILAKLNCSIHIIKLVSGLIFVLRPIMQNVYVKKKYNIEFSNVNKNYKLKNKWDGLSQHIASVVHGSTDITILTIFCSLAEVSVYSVYYSVIKGIKSIVISLSNGIESTFGDMIAKKEKNNLNNKFSLYETIFLNISTILFSCSMVLIVPFVLLYVAGIKDANYVRYIFGYLIVISEYICIMRLPYISLTYSAGCFKETRKGAWIEAISNILISILLVRKMGIIGVAIGTLVAMAIRTIEFIYFANKYILNRNIFISIKKILISIIQTIIIVLIYNILPLINYTNYLNFVINAFIVLIFAVLIVVITSLIFYKNEYRNIIKILKKGIKYKGENK